MKKNSVTNLKTYLVGYVVSSIVMYKLCEGANIPKIVESSEDKVVKIGIVFNDGRQGSGSGAIIESDGTVITCYHVVGHANLKKLFVKTDDGKVYRGLVTKTDMINDLALVRLLDAPPFRVFKHFRLGYPVQKGQQVLLFGSPLGFQGCVSVGWVENILINSLGINHMIVLHSAFTNPGNSGGPLVDLHGRLVGIGEGVVMANFLVPASGMYFAIDIEIIRDFLNIN